jgi:copper transport protein
VIHRSSLRWRRASLAAAFAVWLLIAGSTNASAHSFFIDSDPADGSMLAQAPDHIVLVFSSPVDTSFSDIKLIEASGQIYTLAAVGSYPAYRQAVDVRLPKLPNGSYRLTFTVVDALDFHKTSGTMVFGVGMPAPQTAPPPRFAPAQPKEVAFRWLALSGLSGLLGALTIALAVVGRLPEKHEVLSHLRRSMVDMAVAGTLCVLAGETGLLLAEASSLGPIVQTTQRVLAGSAFGTRWWITVVIALGLLPLLASLRSSFARKRRFFVEVRVLLLAAALTIALGFSGHVAGADGTSIGGVTLLTLHLASMGVWVGGVCGLAFALWWLRRVTGALRRDSVLALMFGFGPIAAAAFALLGVTGFLLSGLQVASVTALLSTQYGIVLVGKVLLVALVSLVGLRHAVLTWSGLWRDRRGLIRLPSRVRLTVSLEGIGALGIVLVASVLGASAPAQGPQFDPAESTVAITQLTSDQREMLITVSVKPNRAGPNLVSVVVANKSWPAKPAQSVTVVVAQPGGRSQTLATTASTRPSGNSFAGDTAPMAFDAGVTQLEAGDVRFIVTVVRKGWPDVMAIVPWKVAPLPVSHARTVLSDQRIAPLANLLAVFGALVALTLFAIGLKRRRRSPLPPDATPRWSKDELKYRSNS